MSAVLISFEGDAGSVQVFEPVAPQAPFSPEQAIVPTDTIAQAVNDWVPVLRHSSIDETTAETVAAVEQTAVPLGGPVARMIRRFIINHVKKETGRSESDVAQAVSQVEATSGRPILDWLTSGGLTQLIQIIVQILAILAPVA